MDLIYFESKNVRRRTATIQPTTARLQYYIGAFRDSIQVYVYYYYFLSAGV